MSTIKKVFFIVCSILMLGSCAPLRQPVIVKNAPIETFRYVYISPTKELTSSSSETYGGQYGTEYRKQVDEEMRKENVIG